MRGGHRRRGAGWWVPRRRGAQAAGLPKAPPYGPGGFAASDRSLPFRGARPAASAASIDALTSLVCAQRPLSLRWPSSARIEQPGGQAATCNRVPGACLSCGFRPDPGQFPSKLQQVPQSGLYLLVVRGGEHAQPAGKFVAIKTREALDIHGGGLGQPTRVSQVNLAPLATNLGRERCDDGQGSGIIRAGVGQHEHRPAFLDQAKFR